MYASPLDFFKTSSTLETSLLTLGYIVGAIGWVMMHLVGRASPCGGPHSLAKMRSLAGALVHPARIVKGEREAWLERGPPQREARPTTEHQRTSYKVSLVFMYWYWRCFKC